MSKTRAVVRDKPLARLRPSRTRMQIPNRLDICTQRSRGKTENLPTDIHSGGRIVHLPLFFKATASHRGTRAAICGRNGPKSPYISQGAGQQDYSEIKTGEKQKKKKNRSHHRKHPTQRKEGRKELQTRLTQIKLRGSIRMLGTISISSSSATNSICGGAPKGKKNRRQLTWKSSRTAPARAQAHEQAYWQGGRDPEIRGDEGNEGPLGR